MVKKSKRQLAQEVITATQILNNAIKKARAAGMSVDIDNTYVDEQWLQSAKVYEQTEPTIIAESPSAKKKTK